MNNKEPDEAALAYAEKDSKDPQVLCPDDRWSDQRRSIGWENYIQDLPQSIVLAIIAEIRFKIGKGKKAVIDFVCLSCTADAQQAPINNELMVVLDLRVVVRLHGRRHCEETCGWCKTSD